MMSATSCSSASMHMRTSGIPWSSFVVFEYHGTTRAGNKAGNKAGHKAGNEAVPEFTLLHFCKHSYFRKSSYLPMCGQRGQTVLTCFGCFSILVAPKTPFRWLLALLFEQIPSLAFSKRRFGGSLRQFSIIFRKGDQISNIVSKDRSTIRSFFLEA